MITKDYLEEHYTKQKKSLHQIAEELGVYVNKIRRLLVKHSIPVRDQSAAQSIALKTGRRKHPTKGKPRTEAERTKISNKVKEAWSNKTDKAREEHAQKSRAEWENLTVKQKNEKVKKLIAGNLESARTGSSIERYIISMMFKSGFNIEFHKKNLIPNTKMSIDIYCDSLATCIEIDGPSHYMPIWGDENLEKIKNKDANKDGLLLQNNYNLIRVHIKEGYISDFDRRKIWEKLEEVLKKIESERIIGRLFEVKNES